jgi:nucleoside-diphosphate-sugar epimerase
MDIIFHLAAQTSAVQSDADPEADFKVNVAPVSSLIKTCRDMQACPVILFAGTVTECGMADHLPVNESTPDEPVTTYDRHKLVAEQLLEEADREGTLRAATLRLPNLYGPGPRSSRADRGILNLMVRRALNGNPVTVYGTGEYLRDYLFIEDAVRAFLVAAEQIDTVHGHHYVLGREDTLSIMDAFKTVAERVMKQTGARIDVVQVTPPDSLPLIETRNFTADASRFKQQTGWRAVTDLNTGLDRTIAFYKNNAAP